MDSNTSLRLLKITVDLDMCMRHKSEALEKFKEFKNEVQNQHGKSIKTLRSDRGGEYLSQSFDELLKECGIVSQLTPPGTP